MTELERLILTHILIDLFWFGVFLVGVALIRHGLEEVRRRQFIVGEQGPKVFMPLAAHEVYRPDDRPDPRATGRGHRDWKTWSR